MFVQIEIIYFHEPVVQRYSSLGTAVVWKFFRGIKVLRLQCFQPDEGSNRSNYTYT